MSVYPPIYDSHEAELLRTDGHFLFVDTKSKSVTLDIGETCEQGACYRNDYTFNLSEINALIEALQNAKTLIEQTATRRGG